MSPHQLPDDDDVSADLAGAYLKQSDFQDGEPLTFTIIRAEKVLFEAKNGRPEERKWVAFFVGGRCLALNKTNLQLLAKMHGPHARQWNGKRVVVYCDPSIMFGGRLTGGLRVRKPTRADVDAPIGRVAVDDVDADAPPF